MSIINASNFFHEILKRSVQETPALIPPLASIVAEYANEARFGQEAYAASQRQILGFSNVDQLLPELRDIAIEYTPSFGFLFPAEELSGRKIGAIFNHFFSKKFFCKEKVNAFETIENLKDIENFNEWASLLTPEQINLGLAGIISENLETAFILAAGRGNANIVHEWIQCDRFKDISATDLGAALWHAANGGHVDVVNTLIRCPRFAEISPKYFGLALKGASTGGHADIVNILMSCNHFTQVSAQDLGEALYSAAHGGHPGIVNTLIVCDLFAEISPEDFGWALQRAVEEGHPDVVNALIDCGRFAEIPAPDFRKAFNWAAREETRKWALRFAINNVDRYSNSVDALIRCSRFAEIPIEDLEEALQRAAASGHASAVDRFLTFSDRMHPEILEKSAQLAETRGFPKVGEAIRAKMPHSSRPIITFFQALIRPTRRARA